MGSRSYCLGGRSDGRAEMLSVRKIGRLEVCPQGAFGSKLGSWAVFYHASSLPGCVSEFGRILLEAWKLSYSLPVFQASNLP
jgi:hypothetical protein